MEDTVSSLGCDLPLHPLPLDRALLLLQLMSYPLLPFLVLLYLAGTTRGPGLLCHLLHICIHQRGPGHWTRTSHLARGHRSLIRHMSRGQLMTFPRICPLLLSSDAPLFHCGPIAGNSDCSTREVHYETYYDLPAFVADPELRDSMRSVQRYSMESFMTPCRFFYPQVVIEFYHTMTSRRVPHPTIIHSSIDGLEGTL